MEKVIIRRCENYDLERMREIIRTGIEGLGVTPKIWGRVTIKPNVVLAHPEIAPSGFTRPEFLDALLYEIEGIKKNELPIILSENSGVGITTARMFKRAGYKKLRENHPLLKLSPQEEDKRIKLTLKKGKIHKTITVARPVVDRDFLIYAPKLKSNVLVGGMTAAIKLNIGIMYSKERMYHHHYDLDQKIADLLEVGYPDLILTDAVEIALGGNQMTQHGHPLGVIIMATNPVAHDAVCAHIFGFKPETLEYLIESHRRGYGPLSLAEIDLSGDVSLEELQKRTQGWENGFQPVHELDINFDIRSGEPYCTGGCHGIMLDWLYMIRDRNPELYRNLPRWTVVIGEYQGDVEAERVMLVGSCTRVIGKLKTKKLRKIKGCPPRHKDLILQFFLKAGIRAPLFRFDMIMDSYFWGPISWLKGAIKNIGSSWISVSKQ